MENIVSRIKIIDKNGDITEVAEYTLDSKNSLINFLEQFENNNYNTWDYEKSKFWEKIVELKHGGWSYYNKEKDITVVSKLK